MIEIWCIKEYHAIGHFRLRIYLYSNVAGIITNILIYGSRSLPVYLWGKYESKITIFKEVAIIFVK